MMDKAFPLGEGLIRPLLLVKRELPHLLGRWGHWYPFNYSGWVDLKRRFPIARDLNPGRMSKA